MKKYLFVFLFGSLTTYAQVKEIKIEINKGNRYTNENSVPISMKAVGASEYTISNKETFDNAKWLSTNTWQVEIDEDDKDKKDPRKVRRQTSIWQIDEAVDGEKWVYIKFKDEAGKESEVYSASVVLDRIAPTDPFIKISPSKKKGLPANIVELDLSASDARYVKISSQKNFYNTFWQAFRPKIDKYDIGIGDGMKYVYVKFRDEAGNESVAAFDQYELDTHPPIRCKLVIENNKDFANNPQGIIRLQLSAVEATQMMISENEKFEGEDWLPYDEKTVEWVLKDHSIGTKKIFAKFRDNFGNESAVVTDDIMFDSQAPSEVRIEIDRKDDKKNIDNHVSLKVFAKNADFMIISNTVNFQGTRWQPYQETIAKWVLGGGFGKKTVYIKFKDKYENETGIYEATVWIEE